jgi:hypothetical protein
MSRTIVIVLAAALACAGPAGAQHQPRILPSDQPAVVDYAPPERPLPHPVTPPPAFRDAQLDGTRTITGQPGPEYWQQRADYDIEARLDPAANRLSGDVRITYRNNSPDTLPALVLKLRQNLHRPDAQRNRPVPLTSGISVSNVTADGTPLAESGRQIAATYTVAGTIMIARLPTPLAPGQSAVLEMAFGFDVPPAGAPRMGQDGEVWYLGYWYPQMAVYDDVGGWHTDPYVGLGEHYMGHGDYSVRITVPGGWLVAATGELVNPEQVLSAGTRERLARAAATDEVVAVSRPGQRRRPTAGGDLLTWHFEARNVRDFAFGTSNSYAWDATRARVGDLTGDGQPEYAMIHAFYRPNTRAWERSAEFARYSVEHLSEMLFPYPYPHMTTVEGIIGGGMEYPMITLIGGNRNDRSLFSVTYHEIAHMWYPMIVGQDEKSFTWMDEGLTSFFTNRGFADFWGDDRWPNESHYQLANTGLAEPPMLHNDQFSTTVSASRVVASYSTPALLLRALEGTVGTEAFMAAFDEYGRRWAFKHPYPWDLFNTFEDVLGMRLDWLWYPMLFDTWTMDHAVARIEETPAGFTVTIEDLGLAPMPVFLTATYADGRQVEVIVPVDVWLTGATTTSATIPAGDLVTVELDPDFWLPDVDRTNNLYRLAPSAGTQ